MVYNPATDEGRVRLLANDYDDSAPVFTDDEIAAFLAMESGSVKRAAAQALDTIADNEALVSKVITSQDVAVDGAKLADSLRKRAQALRDQAAAELEYESGFALEISAATFGTPCWPELTERPYQPLWQPW